MTPTLVIFDCDGVLVDSERLANAELARAVSALGLPTTLEQSMARYKGLSMPSVQAKIEEALGRVLPDNFLDDVQGATEQAFRRALTAVGGVRDVLVLLRERGIAMCVASSGSHDKMALTLSLTDLAPFFDGAIFSASDVKRGKPYPDLFVHAAASMGVSSQDCVVIEDSLPGVQAGVAAHMRVLAFCADGAARPTAMAEVGGEVFFRMAEVPGLLGLSV